MKTAIIIADGVKQIMFTAENKAEETALSMITENDEISIEMKEGTLYDGGTPKSAHGFTVQSCEGGYLRAYPDKRSLMLVLKPKKEKK
jgi:predicted transcriptional regulator